MNCNEVTRKQIVKIHTLKTRLKLDDGQYRLMLSDYWVTTSVDLTCAEAQDLIRRLEEMAIDAGVWSQYSKRGKMRYEYLKDRQGMASPAQLRMIEAMWKDISYTHRQDARQCAKRKFIFRIAGITEMEDISSVHARKIIRALREMKVKRRMYGPQKKVRKDIETEEGETAGAGKHAA